MCCFLIPSPRSAMASHYARRELADPRAIAHLHSWVAFGKTCSDLDWHSHSYACSPWKFNGPWAPAGQGCSSSEPGERRQRLLGSHLPIVCGGSVASPDDPALVYLLHSGCFCCVPRDTGQPCFGGGVYVMDWELLIPMHVIVPMAMRDDGASVNNGTCRCSM